MNRVEIPLEWFLSDREDFRMAHYAEVMGFSVCCDTNPMLDDMVSTEHLLFYIGPYKVYNVNYDGRWCIRYTDYSGVSWLCNEYFEELQPALVYAMESFYTIRNLKITAVVNIPGKTHYELEFYTIDEYFNFLKYVYTTDKNVESAIVTF